MKRALSIAGERFIEIFFETGRGYLQAPACGQEIPSPAAAGSLRLYSAQKQTPSPTDDARPKPATHQKQRPTATSDRDGTIRATS
jgi:hypothetical protein